MENVDDIPKERAPPPKSAKSSEKKVWLYNSAYEILDKFVMANMIYASQYQKEGVYMYVFVCVDSMYMQWKY